MSDIKFLTRYFSESFVVVSATLPKHKWQVWVCRKSGRLAVLDTPVCRKSGRLAVLDTPVCRKSGRLAVLDT